GNVSFIDSLSNIRTADHGSANLDWRYFHQLKLVAVLPQRVDRAGLTISKIEIASDAKQSRVQSINEELPDKLVRRKVRKCAIELHDERPFDAGFRNPPQAFLERANQLRRFVGSQNANGVGIEGHYRGMQPGGLRFCHHRSENGSMPAMDPIKVAN